MRRMDVIRPLEALRDDPRRTADDAVKMKFITTEPTLWYTGGAGDAWIVTGIRKYEGDDLTLLSGELTGDKSDTFVEQWSNGCVVSISPVCADNNAIFRATRATANKFVFAFPDGDVVTCTPHGIRPGVWVGSIHRAGTADGLSFPFCITKSRK